ncbi:hypothetical protein [Pseudonocardia abyssalis]|uniref:Thioesterase domain-containing protein n=1 Tax=Pseudonocardia abyssalis TaxID=2792008 RepID=A0ABS6URV3_9PSEU|nr:hypothetical protein [Pseudonocardia abyssalis]MBW0115667.1 hypothetical protein [Pseudonocardia abyssalis]MBW0134988.1 hypothetical protein [Pseudonocardia abyssalis]
MMFPQCFTRYDWCRSYVLPAHVLTTIPRTGSVGMLGAHNAARGLLVEICRHADATPVALDYRETVLPDGDIAIAVTATARHADGTPLVVATTARARRCPPDRVGDWTLRIDGVHQVEQDRTWPPSPPMQGHMVARLAQRPPAPISIT